MKKEIVKTADAILDRGHRVLLIPVKDGTRIFEVDQKEVKIPEQKPNTDRAV